MTTDVQYYSIDFRKVPDSSWRSHRNIVQSLLQNQKKRKEINTQFSIYESIVKSIQSDVLSFINFFAPPLAGFANVGKNLINIYRKLKESSSKKERSEQDAARLQETIHKKKLLYIAKKIKFQKLTEKLHLKSFHIDKKYKSVFIGTALAFIAIAAAYLFMFAIAPIILAVAGAMFLLGRAMNTTFLSWKSLGIASLVTILGIGLLKWNSVVSFLQSLFGRAAQSDVTVTTNVSANTSTIENQTTTETKNTVDVTKYLFAGGIAGLTDISKISSDYWEKQKPKITEEGVLEKTRDIQAKKLTESTRAFATRGQHIAVAFLDASEYGEIFVQSLIDLAKPAETARTTVMELVTTLGSLNSKNIKLRLPPPPKMEPPSKMDAWQEIMKTAHPELETYKTTADAMSIAYRQPEYDDKIINQKLCYLFQKYQNEFWESTPTAQFGGLVKQHGFAEIHGDEMIRPMPKERTDIKLNINLDMEQQSYGMASHHDIRNYAKQISAFQTRQLYRRQTTLL